MLIYYLSKSKPASEAEPFLRAWKCSKKEIAQVRSALFALEQRLNDTFNSQVLYQVGLPIALDVEKIMACLGHTASFARIPSMYQGLPIYNKKEIKINGNDLQAALNRKPGKWLGDLMIEMAAAILAGELVNEKQAILEWATHKEK